MNRYELSLNIDTVLFSLVSQIVEKVCFVLSKIQIIIKCISKHYQIITPKS